MSYIVVYQRADGSSGVEECADLDVAVVAAERLRNVDSVERPRIFKTEEITYDFRPYYRVEVTGGASESETDPEVDTASRSSSLPPVAPVAVPEAEPSLTQATAEDVFGTAPTTGPPEADPIPADAVSVAPEAVDEEPDEEVIADDDPTDEPAADALGDEDAASKTKGLFSTDNIPDPPQGFPAVTQIADEVEDVTPPRRGLFGR